MPLRIKDWADHYENNRTRGLKYMEWVPIPNQMDGLGYSMLVSQPNGAAYFGVWIAIVEIASRCHPRGTLVRDGCTLTPQTLSVMSRMPVEIIEQAIERLLSTEVGWLEEITQQEYESTICATTQESAGRTSRNGTSLRPSDYRNGTETERKRNSRSVEIVGNLEAVENPEGDRPTDRPFTEVDLAEELNAYCRAVGLPDVDDGILRRVLAHIPDDTELEWVRWFLEDKLRSKRAARPDSLGFLVALFRNDFRRAAAVYREDWTRQAKQDAERIRFGWSGHDEDEFRGRAAQGDRRAAWAIRALEALPVPALALVENGP